MENIEHRAAIKFFMKTGLKCLKTSNVIQSHMSALMRYMLYHFWDNEPTSYSIEFSKVLACLDLGLSNAKTRYEAGTAKFSLIMQAIVASLRPYQHVNNKWPVLSCELRLSVPI
ncbi:hypothetical protein GQX74_007279 [Glossina fuscipes]|nr:hypothetical protein GQX74_007279 [Glossina fuscipes]